MAEKARPIQVDRIGPTGIYPASGPLPPADAEVVGQGELGHPEQRKDKAAERNDESKQGGST